jgi:putative transposase
VSLQGKRLELPSRYRQLKEVYLRYARWDLSRVDLIESRSGSILCAVHPLDKAANAQAIRRVLDPAPSPNSPIPQSGIAPLLKQMMADYAATGLPPAYLPTPPEDPA